MIVLKNFVPTKMYKYMHTFAAVEHKVQEGRAQHPFILGVSLASALTILHKEKSGLPRQGDAH